MRIVGGKFGGRRLCDVGAGDLDAHLRPTSDRLREALFSHLQSGQYGEPINKALVLDLFAGTGALGFEALSRGAQSATFFDNGRVAQELIRQNINKLGLRACCKLIKKDATRPGAALTKAGLIFLDPPYGKGLGQKALPALKAGGWIASEALIIWEESEAVVPPAWLRLRRAWDFRKNWLGVFSYNADF